MTAWLKKASLRLRLFFKSIRFRLTLWTAAILVVILLAFSIFVYYRQTQYLLVDRRAQLQEQAQQLSPLYRYVGMAEPGLPGAQIPDFTSVGSQVLPAGESLVFIVPNGSTLQKIGGISDGAIQTLLQLWVNAGQTPDPLTYESSPVGLASLNLQNRILGHNCD